MSDFVPFTEDDFFEALKFCGVGDALKEGFIGFSVSFPQLYEYAGSITRKRLASYVFGDDCLEDDQIQVMFDSSGGRANIIWRRSFECTCEEPHVRDGSWDNVSDKGICFHCRRVLTAERLAGVKKEGNSCEKDKEVMKMEFKPFAKEDFDSALDECRRYTGKDPKYFLLNHRQRSLLFDDNAKNYVEHGKKIVRYFNHRGIFFPSNEVKGYSILDNEIICLGTCEEKLITYIQEGIGIAKVIVAAKGMQTTLTDPKEAERPKEQIEACGAVGIDPDEIHSSAKQITYTAEFEFPNGDRVVIPDPVDPEWEGSDVIVDPWRKPVVKNVLSPPSDDSFLVEMDLVRKTVYDSDDFEIRHASGTLIVKEYRRKIIKEAPKVLWWGQWTRLCVGTDSCSNYESPRWFKRATDILFAEKETMPIEGSKERPEWPRGSHPRRIIMEGGSK